MLYIAHLRHSPEDTAIGVASTEEGALNALYAAYPAANGRAVSITPCPLGTGLASLEEAPAAVGIPSGPVPSQVQS